MIPTDLAARLRMLAEASFFDSEPPVQGPARVREIQARLPQLLPGQQFSAHITRALPDNTFQAVVAGRTYTLALNQPAKQGDTLELVVTRQTPSAVFARPVGEAAENAANQQAAARPNLSATGRLISFLLTGQPAPQPATLASGKPLLDAPPSNATQLAPALRQALTQSGLFYESHQAKWISGRMSTEALQGEPQGKQVPLPPGTPSTTAQAPRVGPNPMAAASPAPDQADARIERGAAESAAGGARMTAVAERLMPLVHQQLDAMATQQHVLHGQAWPGQHFEWEIDDPRGEGEAQNGGQPEEWNSTLRLSMPRLGQIEARLNLTAAGVGRGIHHQPDGVAYAHDKAGHGRVGQGDGTAPFDLFAKNGDHRPPGPQDVAEARG